MAQQAVRNHGAWQDLRTVTPIRRLTAHVIDQGILIGNMVWAFSAFAALGSESPEDGGILMAVYLLVTISLFIVYVILSTKGKTLGKWMMGIKIIKNDGEAAGFGTVMVRDLLGKTISTVFLYLGFLWILLDSRNQGWHDKFMGTTVVYAKEHDALKEDTV